MRVVDIFRKSVFAVVSGYVALTPLAAAPYIPSDGAQVLEHLPARSSPERREMQQLSAALAAAPGNLRIAADLARLHIGVARKTGDPRYLGYAQAALAPWWSQPGPPPEVRLLRATVLQTQHRFPLALADLDAVVQADPHNAQAWLTRATILQVQGEYAEAKKSCARLHGMTLALVVATCIANSDAVSAQAGQSYARLKIAIERQPDAPVAIRTWTLTLMGEVAARQGAPTAAEAHFREALALDSSDNYLLGAYADFLLDAGREKDVISLLAPHTRVDGLLLRYGIAMKRSGSPELARHVDALQSRFDAAKMRGDASHEREQALFQLHLRDNPGAALVHARNNWAEQKEFADARILLETAAASRDADAAAPVIRWLRATGLQTALLDPLLSAMEEKR